jgi:prepilin-type N-terminal cleavage/methylation domain-containing protein
MKTGMANENAERHPRRAFTMVELLVVIAIIAILAAILIPVVSFAEEHARGTQCLNNQRQITLGLSMYLNETDGLFPINVSAGTDSDTTNNWVAGMVDYGHPTCSVENIFGQTAHPNGGGCKPAPGR